MLGLKFLGLFCWSLQALLIIGKMYMVYPIQGSEEPTCISLFIHIYLLQKLESALAERGYSKML